MKTAIIIYCVLAATFLFAVTLRAEMVHETKPQESTKPAVAVPRRAPSIGQAHGVSQ